MDTTVTLRELHLCFRQIFPITVFVKLFGTRQQQGHFLCTFLLDCFQPAATTSTIKTATFICCDTFSVFNKHAFFKAKEWH